MDQKTNATAIQKPDNMRLLNRVNLACLAAVSKDKTRDALCGLHLGAKHTIATDCRLLLQATYPSMDCAEFPAVGQTEDPTTSWTPVTIPAEQIKAVAKNIPKRTPLLILQTALIHQNGGKTVASTTNLDEKQNTELKAIGATWPNSDAVWPTTKPKLVIAFNPKLLGAAMDALISAGCTTVKLSFIDNLSPMVIEAQAEEQKISGLLMPMRLR